MRRGRLLLTGRIAEGEVFDIQDAGGETQIFFTYSVNGATYESSQSLNEEQRHRKEDYAPGSNITVRYDPYHPANVVVV